MKTNGKVLNLSGFLRGLDATLNEIKQALSISTKKYKPND